MRLTGTSSRGDRSLRRPAGAVVRTLALCVVSRLDPQGERSWLKRVRRRRAPPNRGPRAARLARTRSGKRCGAAMRGYSTFGQRSSAVDTALLQAPCRCRSHVTYSSPRVRARSTSASTRCARKRRFVTARRRLPEASSLVATRGAPDRELAERRPLANAMTSAGAFRVVERRGASGSTGALLRGAGTSQAEHPNSLLRW
jgi:hypothetical protein